MKVVRKNGVRRSSIARKMQEARFGKQTKEQCPKIDCKGLLFANKTGSKWCTNLNCDFHKVGG